jgi:hypothetical protein
MKRMWSVLTGPYLVITVVPSTTGREIALDSFSGYLRPGSLLAAGDLIEFVEKHYAESFGAPYGFRGDRVRIHEFGSFFLREDLPGLSHFEAPDFFPLGKDTPQEVLHVQAHLLHTAAVEEVEGGN